MARPGPSRIGPPLDTGTPSPTAERAPAELERAHTRARSFPSRSRADREPSGASTEPRRAELGGAEHSVVRRPSPTRRGRLQRRTTARQDEPGGELPAPLARRHRRRRIVRLLRRTRQVAARSRGLRRLLPGAATLAVLASVWVGAGALSSLHRPALTVPAAAVKVPDGYLYVARPGDTLWSIASELQPGGDPRPLVAQLEQQLHGAELVAGDRLILP